MFKKITLQFSLVYFIIIGSIFALSLLINTEYTKQLKTTQNQISGIHYIKQLYNLNINIVQYTQELDTKKKEAFKQIILKDINKIYQTQELHPLFKNIVFDKELKNLTKFQYSIYDYYALIDHINRENYRIGDRSNILFENDRKLYFLGTLTTHYLPEYLLSNLITHGIVEHYRSTKQISLKDKNIFIEQNKLIQLSLEELRAIINSLAIYKDTQVLESTITRLETLIKESNFSFRYEDIQSYIAHTHKILELSYKINEENFQLIEKNYLLKQKSLLQRESLYKVLFFLLIVIFSIIIFLYYRSALTNEDKDKELKDINEVLDNFVIYSRAKADGTITYASSALEKISGYSKKELIGNNYKLFKNENMNQAEYKKLWETVLSNKVYTGDVLNKAKDATSFWVRETIIPQTDENGVVINFTTYMVDITDKIELQIANKKLHKLSIYDPLTQVYNRLKLDMILENLYLNYKRYHKVFSIILVDVDYFKSVNDEYGHLVGDEVLKQVSQLIKNTIRESDYFGRWGGEEFLIISESTDSTQAFILAEKVRKTIEDFEFEIVKHKTISLGITHIDEGLTINDLLHEADTALYTAKNTGRNRTIIFKK